MSTVHTSKSKVEILQNFVTFSEYMNFTNLNIIFWCLQVEIDSVEVTQDFEPDNELATALEKYSEKMEVELIKGQSL